MMKREEDVRRISLQSLFNYGTAIVNALSSLGQDAILFLTKESTCEFIYLNAYYFSIVVDSGVEYIELNHGVTTIELRHQFRRNLTVDLAKALNKVNEWSES